MASLMYSKGLEKILDETIGVSSSTLKVMLLKTTYTADSDHDGVDDLSAYELDATGYTDGYGGGGRMTATVTIGRDTTNNRVVLALDDITWTSIGGATNDTIGGAALIHETGGTDASSIPIAFFDLSDTPTNGSGITLDFTALGSGGTIRFNV